jgi:hypothetical protein
VRTIPASVVLNELGLCPHGYAAVRPTEIRVAGSTFPVDTITAAMHLRDLVMGVQLERCAPLEGRKYRDPSARSGGPSTAPPSTVGRGRFALALEHYVEGSPVRADAHDRSASHFALAGTAGGGGSAAAGEGGADVDAVSTSATLE